MSGKNRSKSKTNSTNTSTTLNSAISGDVSQGGIALSGSTINGEVTFTDYGAIDNAFDAFDTAIDSNNQTVKGAYDAVSKNTTQTVEALKEFATKLTVGDKESAKLIAITIVVAVLIALVVWFIWGRK